MLTTVFYAVEWGNQELRIATISLAMPVCVCVSSVRNIWALTGRIFMKFGT
jgi:hypothetical protein